MTNCQRIKVIYSQHCESVLDACGAIETAMNDWVRSNEAEVSVKDMRVGPVQQVLLPSIVSGPIKAGARSLAFMTGTIFYHDDNAGDGQR